MCGFGVSHTTFSVSRYSPEPFRLINAQDFRKAMQTNQQQPPAKRQRRKASYKSVCDSHFIYCGSFVLVFSSFTFLFSLLVLLYIYFLLLLHSVVFGCKRSFCCRFPLSSHTLRIGEFVYKFSSRFLYSCAWYIVYTISYSATFFCCAVAARAQSSQEIKCEANKFIKKGRMC